MPIIHTVGSGYPDVVFCDKDGNIVDHADMYATDYSTAFDLNADKEIHIAPYTTGLVPTGLFIKEVTVVDTGKKLLIPDLQVRPKSGLSIKTSMRVSNSPGTIDGDFPSEICVLIYSCIGAALHIDKGRIAQLVVGMALRPYPKGSKSRVGGFGSTGGIS
jgi:dUTPase